MSRMPTMREVRERNVRRAFPHPIVTVVVSQEAIDAWRPEADPESLAAFEQMLAAGMVEVRS